ncbi:MAG: mannose-6-phosphate isomerase, class I, partial [Pseudomonadota bacterium]
MSELLPIDGQVRRYDWGGEDFIATLLGEPAGGGPVAEYWLGAHPDSPSVVRTAAGPVPLDALVDEDPPRWLGRRHATAFGHWPHLLKVLDVARPLSIQVHPDREQARAGFAQEEALGVPRKAPQRNFHDPNPKPELAVALSPFWLLFGLAPDAVLIRHLESHPSLTELAVLARAQGGAAVFRRVLEADDATLAAWLVPVLEAARSSGVTDRAAPAFWVNRWLGAAPPAERVDRGVFGFLLMNILELAPGAGIFQG